MLQCPRCSTSVPAQPGVCSNCGENVYQCPTCRLINYDEQDSTLHRSWLFRQQHNGKLKTDASIDQSGYPWDLDSCCTEGCICRTFVALLRQTVERRLLSSLPAFQHVAARSGDFDVVPVVRFTTLRLEGRSIRDLLGYFAIKTPGL